MTRQYHHYLWLLLAAVVVAADHLDTVLVEVQLFVAARHRYSNSKNDLEGVVVVVVDDDDDDFDCEGQRSHSLEALSTYP